MHTANRVMDAGEASSSGAVTTTTTIKPSSRKSNLRLQLASNKLLQVDSGAVLSELERANEVTPQLLDTIRELVSVTETFDALTDAEKLKLVEQLIRKVCSKRRDDDVAFQVLLILQTIATKSDYSADSWSLFHTIVDAFVSLLNSCDASDIRSKLLIVFRLVVAHRKRNGQAMAEQHTAAFRKLCDRVLESAFVHTRDTHAKVRCVATQLLATLIRCEALSSDALEREAFRSIVAGTTDFDPAVRAASLRSLLLVLSDRLESGGGADCDSLSRLVDDWTALYKLACGALADDYDDVRAGALRCIFLLAHTSALRDRSVEGGADAADDAAVRRSTIDDAFVRLCSAMTDGSGSIRVSAARLLGAFGHSVSFESVREAIEPRIMVDLRAERTMYRRQADRFRGASLEAANGKASQPVAPRNVDLEGWTATAASQSGAEKATLACGDLDISEMPLAISARSANGALIAGLEDELAAVRNATLRTIVMLARTFLLTDERTREPDLARIVRLALDGVDDRLGLALDQCPPPSQPLTPLQSELQPPLLSPFSTPSSARRDSEDSERLRNGRRFVALTQDYLVDMINDEIEYVRVSAVQQLSRLGDSVFVRQDQLEIMLSALKEASRDVRDSLRQLLCAARLTSKECLRDIVRALLDNLTRYPDDRNALLTCFAQLGRAHAEFVAPLITELLNIGTCFETIEPPLDDPAYTCVLLLVLNACAKHALANVQLPAFVVRHFEFLRSSAPHLVPNALQIDLHPSFDYPALRHHLSPTDRVSHCVNVRSLLLRIPQANQSLARFASSSSAPANSSNAIYTRVMRLVNLVLEDLTRVASTDQQSAFALAERLSLEAQTGLLQSLLESETNDSRTVRRLREAHANLNQLVFLFSGLSHSALLDVQRRRLLISAMQLVAEPSDNVFELLNRLTHVIHDCHTAISSDPCDAKRAKSDDNTTLFTDLLDVFNACRQALRPLVEQTDLYDDSVPPAQFATLRTGVRRTMRNALTQFRFATLSAREHADMDDRVQRTRLIFNEPSDSVDTPIRFSAGLCATIHVDATLRNLADPTYLDYVHLLLRFADGTTLVFPVKHDAIRQAAETPEPSVKRRAADVQASSSYRVVMDISITQPKWSDETVAELSAAMQIPNACTSAKQSTAHLVISSKPVRLLLLPKGKRTK